MVSIQYPQLLGNGKDVVQLAVTNHLAIVLLAVLLVAALAYVILQQAIIAAQGPGSVIGLAPSAAAAQALSDELGIETENTAKWLADWRRVPEMVAIRRRLEANLARHPYPNSTGAARLRAKLRTVEQTMARSRLSAGQLVIVDEASLASTFVLDELVSAARQAGAKLLLVARDLLFEKAPRVVHVGAAVAGGPRRGHRGSRGPCQDRAGCRSRRGATDAR